VYFSEIHRHLVKIGDELVVYYEYQNEQKNVKFRTSSVLDPLHECYAN
jgi:hypothetical protein